MTAGPVQGTAVQSVRGTWGFGRGFSGGEPGGPFWYTPPLGAGTHPP